LRQEADVRIALPESGNPDRATYSALGTDCLIAAPDPNREEYMLGQTMNFGCDVLLDKSSRTILHEFGHMFGFAHEHQRVERGALDPGKVLAYFRAQMPQFKNKDDAWWDEWIEREVTSVVLTDSGNGSVYDRKSIMHYQLPAFLYQDKTERGVGMNTELSELDKKTFAGVYGAAPGVYVVGQCAEPLCVNYRRQHRIHVGGPADANSFHIGKVIGSDQFQCSEFSCRSKAVRATAVHLTGCTFQSVGTYRDTGAPEKYHNESTGWQVVEHDEWCELPRSLLDYSSLEFSVYDA